MVVYGCPATHLFVLPKPRVGGLNCDEEFQDVFPAHDSTQSHSDSVSNSSVAKSSQISNFMTA